MPELPEVETIKTDLQKVVIKKKIVSVEILRSGIIKKPLEKVFKQQVNGVKIKAIVRKGKGLIFFLDNGLELISHLRMTGGWIFCYAKDQKKKNGGSKIEKTTRVRFIFEDNSELLYTDIRCFGEMSLVKDHTKEDFFMRLGPEPFDLTGVTFYKMLQKHKTSVKSLLLDQHFIAGLGNIYVQEALFRAGIHPLVKAEALTFQQAALLLKESKKILRLGIKNRGSTIDSYRDAAGKSGSMSKYHLVYGKEGEKCSVCGNFIKKFTIAGRGTCFCPVCQPTQ